MFVEAQTIPRDSERTADLCIIGAGPAGIAMAIALASSKLKIVIVESGGLDLDEKTNDLDAGRVLSNNYFNLDEVRLRFFGGTSNHWAGRCRLLDPDDFKVKPWIPHSGWPITLDDIMPYYPEAGRLVQFQIPADDMPGWMANNGPVPAWMPASLFENQAWQHSPPTNFGVTYRDQIAQQANLDVILNGNVTDIVTDAQASHVERLEVRTLDGNRFYVKAPRYVLACGGIENARILLNANKVNPKGLGNSKDLVGRYFMEHPYVVGGRVVTDDNEAFAFYGHHIIDQKIHTQGNTRLLPSEQEKLQVTNIDIQFNDDIYGHSGYGALRRIWNAARQHRLPNDFWGDAYTTVANMDDVVVQLLRSWDVIAKPEGPRPVLLRLTCEQSPNPDSRVMLDDTTDALGQRRPMLDWRLTELDRRSIRETSLQVARAVGAANIGRFELDDWLQSETGNTWPDVWFGGYHHLGTTRMTDSAETGVVDPDQRLFEVDNLYVAGSSVYPTGGCTNPTLTIVAMALRLADKLNATPA